MKWLLALVFVAALSACAGTEGENAQNVSNSFGSADVQEITLSDGTPCAVVIGMYKGAISCGWNTR